MNLGVCYYPEQWPQERWPLDAKLMKEAGISLVRIAEFAWAVMEPREGELNWDWLDQAIDVLAEEGLQVILGTPTASPPPWLCRAHPDILPVDVQGRRLRYGSRRHYCANNASYRLHTERIVTAMASRYGSHPAVVGWQIDNEFGCHGTARCYCDTCASAFRQWLKAKYDSLDELNQAWGTIFWSQTYGDWDEIEPPNLTPAEPNPSHVLDYYRFSSDTFYSYQQLQLTKLRALVGENQIVTTNFMSQFTDLDYFDLAKPIDVVTMSSYPTGHAESTPSLYMPACVRPALAFDVGDPYITGFGHMLMRGFKPKHPFWVMEQQCGNVNWGTYNTGVRPGTVRLWTWHALASGADTVVYFRWRAGLYAQEQFHSGLLHHDGSLAVGYNDLEAMRAERSLMAEIAAEPFDAQVAFLLDYDSLWALQLQPHYHGFDYLRHIFVYYRALQRLGLPANIVTLDADLSQYKMVILPTAFVATEGLAVNLTAYAEAGGTVLFGVRSGFKDTCNQVTDQPLPGLLRNLTGITVSDWHSLPPGTSYDLHSDIPGLTGTATVWAEALHPIPDTQNTPPDLHVLAHYSSGAFSASAALTEHRLRAGRALYLGWLPNDKQAETMLTHLAAQASIPTFASVPDGLVVIRRGAHTILLNFTEELLEAKILGRTVLVEPRDVQILNAPD